MEVDCVRPMGGNTGVSIWIEGKLRVVIVSPRVTDAALAFPVLDGDRCRLVTRHLKRIQRAAAVQLQRTDPDANAVFVDETVIPPIANDLSSPDARPSMGRAT